MFCSQCGAENWDTSSFCRSCGKPLKKPVFATSNQPVSRQAAGSLVTTPAVLSEPANSKKSDSLLLYASVICGIAAFFMFPSPFAIMAIALGFFAVFKKNRLGIMGITIGIAAIVIDYGYGYLFSYCPACLP